MKACLFMNAFSTDGNTISCLCTYHWAGDTCETPVPCPEGASTCGNALECIAGDGIGKITIVSMFIYYKYIFYKIPKWMKGASWNLNMKILCNNSLHRKRSIRVYGAGVPITALAIAKS